MGRALSPAIIRLNLVRAGAVACRVTEPRAPVVLRGKFDRLRDAERGDVDGDGRDTLVVADHIPNNLRARFAESEDDRDGRMLLRWIAAGSQEPVDPP